MKKSNLLTALLIILCVLSFFTSCKKEDQKICVVKFMSPVAFGFREEKSLEQKVVKGEYASVPKYDNIYLADKRLVGWFQEKECINIWKFYEMPVMRDMVLYAKYVPKE